MNTIYAELLTPLQQTRADVFEEIFLVFLGLGTLVGVVVVAYIMYNAYKYRDVETGEAIAGDVDRPTLGELPVGGQGGKKLFLSFGLSAVIVVSLIIWTYGMLLYVEDGPNELEGDDHVQIDVDAQAFNFAYNYEYRGQEFSTFDDLVVPAGEPVAVSVTSIDVWHTFGIPRERVKADAIPGEVDETWFIADEPGQYDNAVKCFELCGQGHSGMQHDLRVVDADLFDAVVDAGAMDAFTSALDSGDLSVDSTPEELEQYLQTLEEEEETDDEGSQDEEGGEDGGDETEDNDGEGGDDEGGDDEAGGGGDGGAGDGNETDGGDE